MEELFDTEGIDIDMSEELPEEVPEEVPEDITEEVPENVPEEVPDHVQEQSEEVEDTEKYEKALKKILEDISDKEESETEVEEGSEVEEDAAEIKEDEPETNINTTDVSEVEPLLNDIIREIKESDSSKEVTGMYNTLTSVADSNTLNGKLNEQSATNVILLAILTVLMLDIAIHFCKGVL